MIGDKIKELRKQKGVNQKELAERIGITQNTLNNIENNKVKPLPQTLAKISKELGVDYEEMFKLIME